MGRILITMSGGTTTVNNAILAGVVREARRYPQFSGILAGVPGLLGALKNNFSDLSYLSEEELSILENSPGSAFIGTTRITPVTTDELNTLSKICAENEIEYFINIGGNGTIKQSALISKSLRNLKVAAVPKTVDNDLGDSEFTNVLFSPGFPSCVNYWCQKLTLLNNENLGAASHDKVLIAQTFGRKTGFLAGAVRFADPERQLPLLILLPEDPQPFERILDAILEKIRTHDRALVVMSEGYDIGDIGAVHDQTGQVMYGSSQSLAAQVLVSKLIEHGIQARSYIPTIDQRQDLTSRTSIDLLHASILGRDTIRAFVNGDNGFFISSSSMWSDGHLQSKITKLAEILNYSRVMPTDWIRPGRFDVSDAYIKYLGRFIGGESLTFGTTAYGLKLITHQAQNKLTPPLQPSVEEICWTSK